MSFILVKLVGAEFINIGWTSAWRPYGKVPLVLLCAPNYNVFVTQTKDKNMCYL